MATSFIQKNVMQGSMSPASTSPRCALNAVTFTNPPTALTSVRVKTPTYSQNRRAALASHAFHGSCRDGRRGSFGRGARGPMMWSFDGPMGGPSLEDIAREFGFGAYPGCNPNTSNTKSGQGKTWETLWKDISEKFSLPLDIEEEESQYLLTADVPGLQKSDLKITINKTERSLTISGERRRAQPEASGETATQEQRFKRRFERRMGKLHRVLPSLPENADLESVTARVDKGVLTVSIKKIHEAQTSDSVDVNID